MLIPRIDRALELCEEHASTGVAGDVQMLLTHSLLVLMCAEFERKIRGLVEDRCASIADEAARHFAVSCFENVFRSLRIAELAGLLGRLGEPHKKKKFADALDERAKNMYDSILSQRNAVAHGGSVNATLGDVRTYYVEAHKVLDCFRDALSA